MIFELVRFFLVAVVLGSLVLGIPYLLRFRHNAWAASPSQGGNGLTGSWTGTLRPPQRGPTPDFRPSPFLSEGARQQGMKDFAREKQADLDSVRAIFLTTSLDPFHIASAKLRGSVQMCDRQGKVTQLRFTTVSVKDKSLSLILYNNGQGQNDFGDLNAIYDGSVLTANFHNFDARLQGVLKRGSKAEFDQACADLASVR